MADLSGNTATPVDATYGREGCTIKIYVYDELGRFNTVADLSLSARDLDRYLEGIEHRRAHMDDDCQIRLF
jgi:hypothetical protein